MAARKHAAKSRRKTEREDPERVFLDEYLDSADFLGASRAAGLDDAEALRVLDKAFQDEAFVETQTRRRDQLLPEAEIATLQAIRILIEKIKNTPKPSLKEQAIAVLCGKKPQPDPTVPLFSALARMLQALSHSQRFSMTRGIVEVSTEVHINVQPSDRAHELLGAEV